MRAFLIAMALALGGCTAGSGAPPSASSYGAAPAADYGRLSLRLNPGMSEKDVIGLLGRAKEVRFGELWWGYLPALAV